MTASPTSRSAPTRTITDRCDEGAAFFYLGSPTGLSATPELGPSRATKSSAAWAFAVRRRRRRQRRRLRRRAGGRAPYYNTGFNNGEIDRGWAFVYYGNGGDGPRSTARAVAGRGRSDRTARTRRHRALPARRAGSHRRGSRARAARVETRALGVAFSGAVASWTVARHRRAFAWCGQRHTHDAPSRAASRSTRRIAGVCASRRVSPFFPHSPWLGLAANGPNETDLRTGTASSGVGDRFDAGGLGLRVIGPNPSASACAIAYTLPAPGRCASRFTTCRVAASRRWCVRTRSRVVCEP